MSWIDELLPASYNFCSFLVGETEFRTGRRVDNHEYVQNDSNYPEDFGRKSREYSFTGWTVGDACYISAELLVRSLEAPGPGLLTHPYRGVKQVQVKDVSMSIRKDLGRVVQINITFIEVSSLPLLSIIAETIGIVKNFTSNFGDSSVKDFIGNVSNLTIGSGSLATATLAVQNVTYAVTNYATDSTKFVNALNGIGLIFPNTVTFGRYSNGNLTTTPVCLQSLDTGVSLPTLKDNAISALLTAANDAIAAVQLAGEAVSELLSPLTSDNTALGLAMRALFEAFRNADTDQADAIRLLVQIVTSLEEAPLPTGTYTVNNTQTAASVYTAMCRQQAIYSLALACSSYQPLSSNDANAVLAQVTPIIDYEIQFLGDIGDDQTFTALRTLRAAVVNDLQTRGSTLPALITIYRKASLPPQVVANQIYSDGSRGDELVKRNDPFHPLGLPLVIECLST